MISDGMNAHQLIAYSALYEVYEANCFICTSIVNASSSIYQAHLSQVNMVRCLLLILPVLLSLLIDGYLCAGRGGFWFYQPLSLIAFTCAASVS